ncbi:hypothetical protein GCM10010388_51290 [Streptomyces mauvecolor]
MAALDSDMDVAVAGEVRACPAVAAGKVETFDPNLHLPILPVKFPGLPSQRLADQRFDLFPVLRLKPAQY